MRVPNLLKIVILSWAFLSSCSLAHAKIKIHGFWYLSLEEVAQKFGMKHKWIRYGEKALVYSQWTKLTFEKNKRLMTINQMNVWLGKPVYALRKGFFISEQDFNRTLSPLVFPKHLTPRKPIKHIVIDPGHGGKDHGTSNKELKLKEKELTLDISFRLKTILENNGFLVSLTRSLDTFVPLGDRPRFANENHADLFISLHFNSVASAQNNVSGAETYAFTLDKHASTASSQILQNDAVLHLANQLDPWNALLGFKVQASLCRNLNVVDRGLKRARFAVLKTLKCPGILVEAGFLSNPVEAKRISVAAYRQRIAEAVYEGILEYQKALLSARSS